MSEPKKWNRERTRCLLRYGRKNCGPWDWDVLDDPNWQEGEIPDDEDIDLVIAAPEMLELLQRLVQWDMMDAFGDGNYWKYEIQGVINKATGAQEDGQ